jgi:hypothetical protein
VVVDGNHAKTYTTALYLNEKRTHIALFGTARSHTTVQTVVSTDQQLFNLNPLGMSDGSLFLPYIRFAAAGPTQHPCPDQQLLFALQQGSTGKRLARFVKEFRSASPWPRNGGEPE